MTLAESLKRAENDVRAFPAGGEMCDRIKAALRGEPAMSPATRALWLQLGFDFIYCTAFPRDVFEALHTSGEMDIRWPLTFACRYQVDTSASADEACASFILEENLWDEARTVLPEYSGSQLV